MRNEMIVSGIGGLALGLLSMYVMDPSRGRARRGYLAQKLGRAKNVAARGLKGTARDARNRTAGVLAEAASHFSADDPSNEAVEARIRSALGRVTGHAGAITVQVSSGLANLCGDVLEAEVDAILDCVRDTRGVTGIQNQLTVHKSARGVPALQGEGPWFRPRPAPLAATVLTAVAGSLGWLMWKRTHGTNRFPAFLRR